MDLYLFRHGQTVWNLERRIQGWGDSPLTQQGIAQAEALREKVASIAPHCAFASPAKRALDTANIALCNRIPLRVDERLRERGMGILEGITVEQAHALHPGFSDFTAPPQGESEDELRARLHSFLSDIAAMQGLRVIAFSHGLSIRWLQAIALDDGTLDAFLRTPWIDNSALLHLRRDGGRWSLGG